MRFHVGAIPEEPAFDPRSDGWHALREPRAGVLMLIAVPLGMLLAVAVALAWARMLTFGPPSDAFTLTITLPGLVGGALALLAFLAIHEALHVVPALVAGSSRHVVVGFWPRYAAPYVAYTGELSREVQLVSGALPLIVLTVLPFIVAWVVPATRSWMAALSIVNTLGSGADLIMLTLMLKQVPARATIRNHGQATWWKPAA